MISGYIQAGESIVVHDTKREIDTLTHRALVISGYKAIVIDFIDDQNAKVYYRKEVYVEETVRDNKIILGRYRIITIPEGKKYKYGCKYTNVSDAVELVMVVSRALTWEEDAEDPFWHMGTGDMFAGGALFAMAEGIDEFVNTKTARYVIELGDDSDEKRDSTLA